MFGTYMFIDSNNEDYLLTNPPSDFSSFYKSIQKYYAIEKETFSNQFGKICIICSEKMEAGVQLSRKCQCKLHPCEGHECKCTFGELKILSCCFKCICQNLWQQSNDAMKKMSRFRAKCPFCKAE